MKFRESKLAHQYCVGTGLEIGGSAHNPFGLDAKNVDFTKQLTSFKKEEIRLCGEYRPVDIEATGDKIPLLDESQDFIVSSHVLDHFIDPIKTLLEWYRLVKYGGVIFMIVPHKERTFDKARQRTKLKELIDRHDGKIKLDETSHEHHSVWITEDVVELIGYMNRSGLFPNPVAIEAVQDIDDKVGNGFTIVLRKLRGKITEFSSHSEVKFSDINKNERIENQSIRSTSKLLIGILTVDAFNTACAYIRLRSPLSDLQKKGMIEIFKICEVRKRNLIIDFETIKNLDVLIIQRQFPGIFPYKNLLKKLGKDRPKIVFEIDDAFNLAPKNHPGYTYYLTIKASIEEYIKNADLVTVSTQFLKSCYNQLNRNIVVLQNSLDNQIWSGYRRRITSGNPVKIIFSGTVTHFSDLQVIEDAIKKIIIEFGDRVQFLLWGNTSPNLRRYSQVKKFGEFLPDYVEYAGLLDLPFLQQVDPATLVSEVARKEFEARGALGFTQLNSWMLAIFMAAIVLWGTGALPNYLTSLLVIIALVMTGVLKERVAYAQLGHPVMWLNIMSFVLASMLVATGLAKRVALWLLLKFGHKASTVFLVFIVLNTALSAFVSATTAKAAIRSRYSW